jgi:hypothetical protein
VIELWRPIDGWTGYFEVSNRGRVRSVARTITLGNGTRRRVPGKVLKLSDGPVPHCTLSRPGLRTTFYPKANGRRNHA